MGLPDRARDFTSATVDDILRNLEGPCEESRAFRDFWYTYGEYFKADYSAHAAYIDEFVSRSRYLMSVVAPARFKEIIERVTADDARFAADCEATCEELRAYGSSIDVLIEAISDKKFPAGFDPVGVESKLRGYAAVMNPKKAAFIKLLMEQLGLNHKDASLMWQVFGKGLPVTLSADAIPFPQPQPDPFYVAALILWLLLTFGAWALSFVDWEALWEWVTGGPDIVELPPVGTLGIGARGEPFPPVSPDSLPDNAEEAYRRYRARGWVGTLPGATPHTGAGGTFDNDGSHDSAVLPKTDADGNPIDYREFDVNNKVEGEERDGERLVLGSDGKVYYTNDHYKTFVEVSPEAGTGGDNNSDGGGDSGPTPSPA